MCATCLCVDRFGLGWAHDEICYACHMFMHFPCIRTFFNIFDIIDVAWDFSDCSFLFLPLFLFTLVVSMAPKRKSTPARNPLHLGASSSSDPHLLTFDFVMMMPLRHFRRTSPDEAFIRNAKSFYWTLLTPTFPLSFIVGERSHCVTSRSNVLSCLSRSSTPTCKGLIVPYPWHYFRRDLMGFIKSGRDLIKFGLDLAKFGWDLTRSNQNLAHLHRPQTEWHLVIEIN